MVWVKIKRNTYKSYCDKSGINSVKVFVEDWFNGMTDGIDAVNKEMIKDYNGICESGKYGQHLYYDSEKDRLISTSMALGTQIITDERFEDLKKKFRQIAIVEVLQNERGKE